MFEQNAKGWIPCHLHHYSLGQAFSVGAYNVGQTRKYTPIVRRELELSNRLKTLKNAGATHIEFEFDFDSTMTHEDDAKIIKKVASDLELKVGVVIVNFYKGRPEYAEGNFAHHDAKVRDLAVEDAKECINFCLSLDAPLCRCLSKPNGPRIRQGVSYVDLIRWKVDSLNQVLHWTWGLHVERSPAIILESRHNESTMLGFPATVGDIVQMCGMVNSPVRHLVGGCPELDQEVTNGSNFAMALTQLHLTGKLFHLYLSGATGKPTFPADLPFGSENPLDAFETVWQLTELDYHGLLGINIQPRPTDSIEQYASAIKHSIRNFEIFLCKVKSAMNTTSLFELSCLRATGNQTEIEHYFAEIMSSPT